MFSFIKNFQKLLNKIKQNKGLTFTLIVLIATISIFVFMYLLLNMTNDVRKDVYKSIYDDYQVNLQNILEKRKQKFYDLSQVITENKKFLTALKDNNKQELTQYRVNLNAKFQQNNVSPISVDFFSAAENEEAIRDTITSILRSKSSIFGLEVQPDGVFITLIEPVLDQGNFLGLVEVKQSIHSLTKDFEVGDNNFVFLINKKMLIKLSLKAKSGKYKDVVTDYSIDKSVYATRFYSKIIDNGEENFQEDLKRNYGADDLYFKAYRKATDINGVEIGMFILGEGVERNNGFVNIVDSLVKSLTSLSLGLVISITLFLF